MSQYKVIDGLLLRDMAMAGNALLEKNREAVDALNVFPVPDEVPRPNLLGARTAPSG